MGWVKDTAEILFHPVRWIFNKPNRVRLRGGRVQVISLIVTRDPSPLILLGKSPYNSMWMPPQEGVEYGETIDDALLRCLNVECGANLTTLESNHNVHVRSIAYVDSITLPVERHGERPVAGNISGTVLEGITLRSKAYWAATVIVATKDAIVWRPNHTEIVALEWFSFADARDAIKRTNHEDKSNLLLRCVESSARGLLGSGRIFK